ncbi:hypothetical protein UA08_05402 [Talaromyces atroroseus]|uniref:Rab-GAP TBC domain-containing protein n=1 Tax=Talaromyces atroroseus TaxID=1441469 RepID=A0A225AM20_TALAT|nr:hypothetical protein UA08_05402 [Talaromyces atroroseus]OKL59364.1 hypothetical protein UA08_05402 [Talaromyces atroroseus]
MDETESKELLHGGTLEQSIYADAKETAEEFDNKRRDIESACQRHDIKALVEHAVSPGGLLTDGLRQVAWPILLGYNDEERTQHQPDWKSLPRHGDEEQVKLDVNRSFVYYPQCVEEELSKRKHELSDLITETLRRYPMLCYFQGYHDIAQVLLLVLGAQLARPAFARVSLLRIRDYMLPSLSPALKHLHLIPSILEASDTRIHKHISETQPYFALAAALTLYAHDIEEYQDIVRLYDFLLAHEPVVAIYLFAAIILSRKDELLKIPIEEPEMLHFTLSKMPQPLDLENLISSTLGLYHKHPPESLPFRAWWKIPRNSVLRTSRILGEHSSLQVAEEQFLIQVKQLRREEFRKQTYALLWRYRRPIGSLGFAVLIGLVSIYLRKTNFESTMWSYIARLKDMFYRGRQW